MPGKPNEWSCGRKPTLRTAAIALTVASALCVAKAASADQDSRFCVVPVKNTEPSKVSVGHEAWRLTSGAKAYPGVPSLIFTPHSSSAWTIDDDRRLVPYLGSFPTSYLDRDDFIQEPWTGRLIAKTYGRGISVLNPGSSEFIELAQPDRRQQMSYSRPYLLPRRHLTIVVSRDGIPAIVKENSLETWLSLDDLTAAGVGPVRSMHDAPALSAVIVLGRNGQLHALSDDGKWQKIGRIDANDWGEVREAPGSGVALFEAGKSVVLLEKDPGSADITGKTIRTADHGASSAYSSSKLFRQVLTYDRGNLPFDAKKRWRRFNGGRLEDIPGGNIALREGDENGWVRDLPTIGRALIDAHDGFYLYDGQMITPVIDGGRERVGDFARVYDLTSVKRVIVVSKKGFFELTAEGRLAALMLPFDTSGWPEPSFADWPESGVAILSTVNGVFALDANLQVLSVAGGERIGTQPLDFPVGVNPSSGEMVINGERGLFLLVDSHRTHDNACERRQSLDSRFPASNICLRPIPGTTADKIGFAVGQLIEAPNGRDVLLDTVRGLFSLSPEDEIHQLESRNGQFTRDLFALPWSGDVIAGGAIDSIVRGDMSVEVLSNARYSKIIGVFPSLRSILIADDSSRLKLIRWQNGKYGHLDTRTDKNDIDRIIDTPWLGGPLAGNWSGLFLMDREGALVPFSPEGAPRYQFNNTSMFSINRYETVYLLMGNWFRITADRKWKAVEGLPPDVIFDKFDPGSGDVFLGTRNGIYALDKNGHARPVRDANGAPSGAVRSLAHVPGTGMIAAGGDEGLFRITPDIYQVTPVADGSDDLIGSVQRIFAVDSAEANLVETSTGAFTYDGKSLQRVNDPKLAGGSLRIIPVTGRGRVFANEAFAAGALLGELGGRNARGECLAPVH